MTRLDQVFVVLAVFAVLVARWARRAEGPLPVGVLAGNLLQVGAVFSLAIAPYFLWNWMSFGHLVPISGALETSFPVVKPSPPHLRSYHARYGQGLLLAGTAALWARANLPPEAVVGMTDRGLFGYLSGRPTVDLDGLINGCEYQEALHRRELSRFFAASPVTHIAVSAAAYHEGAHFLSLPARAFRGRPFVLWELARLPACDDGLDPEALAYRAPRQQGASARRRPRPLDPCGALP